MIRSEGGQSAVEFALVVPVILMLFCGIFDFGRVLYAYMNLEFISQETVRLAGLGKDDAEIEQAAHDFLHTGDPGLLEVTISPDHPSRESGSYVTVQLQYPVQYVTPFVSKLFSSPYRVNVQSTIRVE